MPNVEVDKKVYPDWVTDEGEIILNEIQKIKNSKISGMEKFRHQRSKVMELAYICMQNTNSGFGACQRKAWELKKSMEKI